MFSAWATPARERVEPVSAKSGEGTVSTLNRRLERSEPITACISVGSADLLDCIDLPSFPDRRRSRVFASASCMDDTSLEDVECDVSLKLGDNQWRTETDGAFAAPQQQ